MPAEEFEAKLAELMGGGDGSDAEDSVVSVDADSDVEEGGGGAPPPPPTKAAPFVLDLLEDAVPLEPVPGRLFFTVTELVNIKGQSAGAAGGGGTMDAVLKLKLGGGAGSKAVDGKSDVMRGVKLDKAELKDGPCIVMDIVKPAALHKPGLPLMLEWELWEAGGLLSSGTKVGGGQMDFSKIYKCTGGKRRALRLDLTNAEDGAKQDLGEVHVVAEFFHFWPGMLVVTCLSGHDLPNMDTLSKQDPFVEVKLGKQTKRSATVKEGGEHPVFMEDQLELWVDESSWQQPLLVKLWDEDMTTNDLIGKTTLDVLRFTASLEPDTHVLPLKTKSGRDAAGTVRLLFQFFPAGKLRIKCLEGRGLASEDTGRQDPYVQFRCEGSVCTHNVKTKVDRGAGATPVWGETFELWVVDHSTLRIEVKDHDRLSSDDLIGSTSLPLSAVYATGIRDAWVPIKARSTWGSLEARGEIKLEVDFVAHEGVGFPQRHAEGDVHDHTRREYRPGVKLFHFQKAQGFRPRPTADSGDSAAKPKSAAAVDDRFTEEEIEMAFKFIDLDHNLVVGPAEVRHILTCMGELITEAEVMAMISLADRSGDGQISFDEFYALCRHPDPASPDFLRDDRPEYQAFASSTPKPKPPSSGDGGLPSTKALELQRREEKRVYCLEFVANNALRLPDLKKAFLRYRQLDGAKDFLVTFEEMLTMFDISFAGDVDAASKRQRYRQMYNVFMQMGASKLDLRQLLLALNNFTGADRNQRVNFCFYLYDVDNSGTLSKAEVTSILLGNHMASDASTMKGKVNTIFKQADKDDSGTVDLEEFVIIAQKFPSLMFPSFASAQATAASRGTLPLPSSRQGTARSYMPTAAALQAGVSEQPHARAARLAQVKHRPVVGQDTMFAMPAGRSTARTLRGAAAARQGALARNAAAMRSQALATARGTARGTSRRSARVGPADGLL